jgi:predicted RNA binding protein YcfA (HicA-like mRNA interferase family)
MNSAVPFLALRDLLVGLGFRFQAEPGSHVAFRHSASRALIVLRFYQDDDLVSPTDLAIARRVPDEFGVLPREQFETTLSQRVPAG